MKGLGICVCVLDWKAVGDRLSSGALPTAATSALLGVAGTDPLLCAVLLGLLTDMMLGSLCSLPSEPTSGAYSRIDLSIALALVKVTCELSMQGNNQKALLLEPSH